MGLAYNFYFQQRTQEGWGVPADFTNQIGYNQKFGYFTWFRKRDVRMGLFLSDKALFPLHKDFPPEIEQTPLFQRSPPAFTEWFFGWLPFEELLLDCWEETSLLVSKRIAASYARLFTDGQQPFPHQALLSAGLGAEEVEDIADTSNVKAVDESVNYEFGKARNELEHKELEHLVWVTWKVTISDFLGEWWTDEFRKIRQYGPDTELRIICLLH